MKKFLSISFFLVFSYCLIAQSDSEYRAVNLEHLNSGTSHGIYTFDKKIGYDGTQFIFKEYKKGTVLLNNKTKLENIMINLNNHTCELFFIDLKTKNKLVIKTSVINGVYVNNNFYKPIINTVFDELVNNMAFFNILADKEKYILIKYTHINLREANYKGPYSPNAKHDTYTPEDKYFIKIGSTNFKKIKVSRNNIQKLLPMKKDEIKKLFKNRNFDSDDDFIKFVFHKLLKP